MMDLVVADHYLDPLRGMYILVLGRVEEREVLALDENGNIRRSDDQPVVDPESGEPTGEVIPGEPLTEIESIIVPVEDVAFSADDPKWKGRDPEDIAREQRKLARAALRKVERDAGEATARREALPGVGGTL